MWCAMSEGIILLSNWSGFEADPAEIHFSLFGSLITSSSICRVPQSPSIHYPIGKANFRSLFVFSAWITAYIYKANSFSWMDVCPIVERICDRQDLWLWSPLFTYLFDKWFLVLILNSLIKLKIFCPRRSSSRFREFTMQSLGSKFKMCLFFLF